MEQRMGRFLRAETDHGRKRGHGGAALIFLIICMAVFAALGTAMVSLFGTASLSQFLPNQVRRADYMAESGLRYAFAEVRRLTPPQNIAPSQLADWWIARFAELCNGNNVNGKDFTLTTGVQSFNLKVQPYWFKVTTTGTNLTTLSAVVLGQGLSTSIPQGASSFPDGTRLQVGLNSPVRIDVASTTVAANRQSVTFTLTSPINIPEGPVDAYLVFSPSADQTLTWGSTLTLNLNNQSPIPPRNGTFLLNGKVYSYESLRAGSTILNNVRWKGSTTSVSVSASDDIVFGQNARVLSTGTFTFGGTPTQRQASSYAGFASSSLSAFRPPQNNVPVATSFDDLSALDLSRSGDRVIVQGYIATGGVHMYWAAFTKLGMAGYRFRDTDDCWIGYHVAPLSTALRNTLRDSYNIHGTLSYDVQVKVGWDLNIDYAAQGISFRWHVPFGYDSTTGPRQGYGVSFLRYGSLTCPPNHQGDYICNAIKPTAAGLDGKLLAVLWRQTVDGGGNEVKECLAYAVLGDPTNTCDPAAGCTGRTPADPDQKVTGYQGYPDGRVNDDATITVRVEDKFVTNTQRVNEIKVFWGDSSPAAKFAPSSPSRIKDAVCTNAERARYCAQWVTDPDCNGNALFPTWPRNKFEKDGLGHIASWYNNDFSKDYFTLASQNPTAPFNAVIWTRASTAPGDVVLLADGAAVRTDKFVLDSFSTTREEVGLHAFGNLNNGNFTVAFDDLALQILGENE